MTDVFSPSKRSEIMSRIRSKNTKLDRSMAHALKKYHVSFKQYPKIFGSPDFLVINKIVIFCDSSFWHGKNWKNLRKKLSSGNNPKYWVEHIMKNKKRDREVTRKLRAEGYAVVRFWDTDIYKKPERCIEKIREIIVKLR